jgi:uncharacterized protein (UPF0333 family)
VIPDGLFSIRFLNLLLFFVIATALSAQSISDEQQLLNAAAETANIASEGSVPFQLEAEFTISNKVPLQGQLTWKWSEKDRWSQDIIMPNFRQLTVRLGDTVYTAGTWHSRLCE